MPSHTYVAARGRVAWRWEQDMRRVWAAAVLAVLAVFGVAMGGVASADGDPLVGTWHERDEGTSNIFWFIDEPVDGVFPVTYYDDWTGVCDNNGPMLWAGFATKDGDTLIGSFGSIWCPENGAEASAFGNHFEFEIVYDAEADTISRTDDECLDIGTRQPEVKTIAKAIHELEKGKYPESPGPLSCTPAE